MKKHARRKTDGGIATWLWRNSKNIAGVLVLVGMMWGLPTYFATAADVNAKFTQLRVEIKANNLESRKARIEDELYRLRNEPLSRGNDAQIKRFEAELLDISAKLRDMAKQRAE